MDEEKIYFIVGILLSIITAYWGIWHSNKSRSKTSLSLIDQNWMSLINTFEDNFKILKLENYNLPLNTNLYYYEGIINTGNTDIDKSRIHKNIKIALLDEIKIIELKTKSELADKIGLHLKTTDNNLSINWDLLKPYESFSFEMIIESKKNLSAREFHKKLVIDHRISDLKLVERIDDDAVRNNKKNPSVFMIIMLYLIILSFGSLMFSGFYQGIKSFFNPLVEVKYSTYSKANNKPVEIKYFDNDKVKISSEKFDEIVLINDLDKKTIAVPEITIIKNKYYLTIMGFIFSILTIYSIFYLSREIVKSYRIRKIINSLY